MPEVGFAFDPHRVLPVRHGLLVPRIPPGKLFLRCQASAMKANTPEKISKRFPITGNKPSAKVAPLDSPKDEGRLPCWSCSAPGSPWRFRRSPQLGQVRRPLVLSARECMPRHDLRNVLRKDKANRSLTFKDVLEDVFASPLTVHVLDVNVCIETQG